MTANRKYFAEFFGTFWLVLAGCGSAVLSASIVQVGIGLLGVSLAFGLAVLTMAYSIGPLSGAHLNPAVSIGLYVAGRFQKKHLAPYIASQLAGAILGAFVLYLIVTGNGGSPGDFAANGYGAHSPGGYHVGSAFLTEFVLTFVFLMVILGATHIWAAEGFAGVAIGFTLTLIHLISIPVTNTSVNPARSVSQAVFVGDWAFEQLWLFILAPVAGAALAGFTAKWLWNEPGNAAR